METLIYPNGQQQDIEITTMKFFSLLLIIYSFAVHAEDVVQNSRFCITGSIAYDRYNKIAWERCSVGQKWAEGKGCIGKPKGITFSQAQKLTNSKWRVPTKEEIQTIFLPESTNTKIDGSIFPTAKHTHKFLYWTNEKFDDSSAWYADFSTGTVDHIYGDYDFLNQKFNVRLIRTDFKPDFE